MKKLTVILFFLSTSLISFAQKTLEVEPLFKVSMFTHRDIKIYDPNHKWSPPLFHTTGRKFDYYINLGFRVNYRKFSLESENITHIATDNFISNYPYLANYHIRVYYNFKKFKIGFEHLCVHPISSNVDLQYQVIASQDEIYISYNL